jgi:TatD DNase family protein
MSGSLAYLEEAVQLGGYVSFAGNLTYKNAHQLRELALHVPKDRLLIETDAPFLPPQSKRGKTNEPQFITETAAMLAATLGIAQDECEALTTKNAEVFFTLS